MTADGGVDPGAIDRTAAELMLAANRIDGSAQSRDDLKEVVSLHIAARTTSDYEAVAAKARTLAKRA